MAELRADSVPTDNPNTTRRPGKPPVKIPSHGSSAMDAWQQCCPRASQRKLPKSGPQTTILHAAHAYEGTNWVAYNRLFRREMLAKKDLNWSRSRIPDSTARPLRGGPNATLSASTASPRTTGRGPHNPNPPFLGWFQGTPLPQEGPQSQLQSLSASPEERRKSAGTSMATSASLPGVATCTSARTPPDRMQPFTAPTYGVPSNPGEPGTPGSETHLHPGRV